MILLGLYVFMVMASEFLYCKSFFYRMIAEICILLDFFNTDDYISIDNRRGKRMY